MNYPSQEISLQKLLSQLQDSGNDTTTRHHLELLEGAYLIKSLQKYSGLEVRKIGSSDNAVMRSNSKIIGPNFRRNYFNFGNWNAFIQNGLINGV
jgi:predicted AAA+ superfamily ATPase